MDERIGGILILVLMIALSVIFQVQMKLFAGTIGPLLAASRDWQESALAVIKAAMGWRGLTIAFLAVALFLLWLLALTRLDLSFSLPIASIALVVTAVGGGLWLGEHLSLMRVVGLLVTAVGISLVLGS